MILFGNMIQDFLQFFTWQQKNENEDNSLDAVLGAGLHTWKVMTQHQVLIQVCTPEICDRHMI